MKQLEQYEIEETIPLQGNEDGETEIPGYGPVCICTSHARFIAEKERGKVFGFYVSDNPAPWLGEICDGHDFAVIDGRWIVDTWARFLECLIPSAVIDMQDPQNSSVLRNVYGDPRKWELVDDYSTPAGMAA